MIRTGQIAALTGMFALLAGCVPAPKAPPPPAPVPRPPVAVPAPPSTQAQPAGGWEDWPIATGDWQFAATGTMASARYATSTGAAMTLACDRSSATVTMNVAGMGLARDLSVRTTGSGDETLAGTDDGSGGVRVVLPASAGVLDRIAFSRGRFALTNSARQGLALPAWPEIGRLVEFCRGG